MDRKELRLPMERYFHLVFEKQVILDFLKNRHGIAISLSTLKRRLRDYLAWAASRVQSSVAIAKIKASHSCALVKGC